MSTPTPRTDAAYAKWQEGWDRTPFGPDFARKLERELATELATERARLKEMAAELAHCAGYIASVRTDRLITWHEELYALQTLEWAEGAFEIAEKANAVLEAHDAAIKEGAK